MSRCPDCRCDWCRCLPSDFTADDKEALESDVASARKALAEFVAVFEGERPDLADFNDAYELACEWLGREPKEIE